MKRIALSILAGTALLSGVAALADPMYISDKLVVNVYAEANQDGSKLATLDSGDAVETIEKVDAYTHVRLADNREGWIKSSYLTAQVPAIVRLKELEKERGASPQPAASQLAPSPQLVEELKQIKEQNAALQSELAAAKQAAHETGMAPALAQPSAPQGHLEGESSSRGDSISLTEHVGWGAALAFVGGAIGFLLGYQALARRIRRKYGSVKIY